jgi:hypothetical protein
VLLSFTHFDCHIPQRIRDFALNRFTNKTIDIITTLQGMAKTESLINSALDQISDMLEMLCLKHIFTLPQGLPIRLKHYEVRS